MWWLLLIPLSVFAKDPEIDVDILEKLDENMPSYHTESSPVGTDTGVQGPRKYIYPIKRVSLDQIRTSGTAVGAIKEGTHVVRLEDDKKFYIPKNMNVTYFLLEDEHGFKYLSSKGKILFKLDGDDVINTTAETNLFEPPDQYTPAPRNILVSEYDNKFRILPEPIFYAGLVDGSYMADLFNDERARYGKTTQFGMRAFAKWDWPIKAGLVFSYERSYYNLKNDGEVLYTSPSIGPAFRTRDFVIADFPFRFQTQYRVSPLARADIETRSEDLNLKFNSADLLFSIENPTKNRFGEFVLGFFFQAQWLNLRDQKTATKLIANNQSNNSYGISFSQVFE